MKEWDDVRWFEFQQLRFVYQPESFTFVRLQYAPMISYLYGSDNNVVASSDLLATSDA